MIIVMLLTSGAVFVFATFILIKRIVRRELEDSAKWIMLIFAVLGTSFSTLGIVMFNNTSKPTAMDVYQGKTTLEITYKDGVPIDSVVVFKDKEK